MDSRHRAQDILRCALCTTEVALMYCIVCHTNLCKDCIIIHFSDKSQAHNIVPIEQFSSTLNYPKCPTHPTKQCELNCTQCNVPFCTSCLSSGKHLGHKAVDIFEEFDAKKESLKNDLQEIENSIFPKYKDAASIIQILKADWSKNSKKQKADLIKHGEALHKEIDIIIENKQAEIDDMNTKYTIALGKQEDAINSTITEMEKAIQEIKRLLDTSDVCLVFKYQSMVKRFRKLNISIPTFQPVKINREHIMKQFGSLTALSVETEDQQSYTVPSQGTVFSPPDRPLLDVPKLITELNMGYKYLHGVPCMWSDEEIWTRGDDKILKLYNLNGELVKYFQTKSGNVPQDIAVTRSGYLVYTDYNDSSVNLVNENNKIRRLVKILDWKPHGVCSTSSDDLLVIMNSDDGTQTKVMRYSDSTEKQSIQFDDQGKPLYTSGDIKYLSENRNLDICVADNHAHAVVVVSAAGKLCFRYSGPSSTTRESFDPRGITTDSAANILIGDYKNDSIHIIDRDGHFLRYIDNCCLQLPWGLCVDSKDNLFVAENITGKVKKLQYYK